MYGYEGSRTPKSRIMPAQAYSSPDSYEQGNDVNYEYLTVDGSLYVMNVPLCPTG